jgi:hypothetical protein
MKDKSTNQPTEHQGIEYQTPEISVLGSISQLTQGSGTAEVLDVVFGGALGASGAI